MKLDGFFPDIQHGSCLSVEHTCYDILHHLTLTERQRVILSARARGEKFDSIARRLFISRKVAEEHWAAVARKYASFLRDHSPADLERLLGLEPVDLTDPPADLLAG